MLNTDLKFFTNEPERDLYSRFAAILKSNTQFFDVLVGYFRTSGFFKMYKSLEDVEKIRILVGLNVDKFTVKIIDHVKSEIENEFESATDSEAVEEGVRVFIEWLKSGKLEIHFHTNEPWKVLEYCAGLGEIYDIVITI